MTIIKKHHRRHIRRTIRSLQRDTTSYVEQHIWGKWHHLGLISRFLTTWLIIIGFSLLTLGSQISTLQSAASIAVPDTGGIFTEAALGTVDSLNPIIPESTTASDINRLIFSSLTRYNSRRQIVPDLATSWTISPDRRTYTFKLRQGVKWHDGVPFTASDVEFTLAAIQNPDTRSPLAPNWQGVKAQVKDPATISFILPSPLDSFMDSTTISIVPRHLLEGVEPALLRQASFNQHPVGTGPFMIKSFATAAHEISLAANPDYYLGRPKLDQYVFRFYQTPDQIIDAYAQQQITSVGRLTPAIQSGQAKLRDLDQYSFSLPQITALFFNTTSHPLDDKDLRATLSRATNRRSVLQSVDDSQGTALSQPLLPGQIGYTAKYQLPALSPDQASHELESQGWTLQAGQTVRQKDGQRLEFTLVTLKGGELALAAANLQEQWRALGVKLTVKAVAIQDLQQTYMRPRNYQLLLYGLNLGADPDVYPYWHSTQAKDPGLNLSGYDSSVADHALESARIQPDTALREAKYHVFLDAWNQDAPAIVQYQSSYQYGVRSTVAGLTAHDLVTPADRFYGVERWTVRQRYVSR